MWGIGASEWVCLSKLMSIHNTSTFLGLPYLSTIDEIDLYLKIITNRQIYYATNIK
jgi:hypothetical protein